MTFMTLPQRIELEQGKKAPPEIKELTLSHAKSTTVEGLSDEFTNLEILNLVGVGLEDISGLPKLPSLRILDLSNNALSFGLEALLNCPNLETLNLSANKISTVDVLIPLAKLSCLTSLDLFNCEVTSIENYRKMVFAALPNLKYLDGLDENNEEEPSGVVTNGELDEANGDEKVGNEDDENDSEDDEEEEEYGIEALQRSGDLEDDDEDYAPGEEEDAELGEYDDDDDDEDDDEDEEDDDVEDDGANLSGAGVTGPRRPASKRRRSDLASAADDEAPAIKQKAPEEAESHVSNGSKVE